MNRSLADLEVLAVIPARGGSKGLLRKNVRLLAGRPLIGHTIEQAQQARSVSRVTVSTDDAEIAAVSERYGAEVIPRPAEICGDSASSESALLHALDHLRERENYEPDLLLFLQCTSPLTRPEDIDATVAALVEQAADSALAVTPFHGFIWRQPSPGEIVGVNHDQRVRPLRQEREAQYLETGAVYVMRVPGFREAGHRFFGRIGIHVMPRERCLEIDSPVDFRIAEVLMRERYENRKLDVLPRPVSALVLDFDGVFTDNRVLVLEDGREAVLCNRSDGWGLQQLKRSGLPILVLSTEQNAVVRARCDKLGIDCLHGVRDKRTRLEKWLEERDLDIAQVVYVGNDVNDLECLQAVGCGVAVSDAYPEVQAAASLVLSAPGGFGAIRELTDLLAKSLYLEE